MKTTHFVGIDISKASFDVTLLGEDRPEVCTHQKFDNTLSGHKQLLNWLKKQKVNLAETFFIMEHTGWYTLELCCFLQEKELDFVLLSPLHLKRSLGLVRGKNDKVDARRIAYFAFLHRHELKSMQLPSACLLKLKNLFAFRDRLIKTQASLKQTIKVLKDINHIVDNKFIVKESEKQLKFVEQQVKQTEEQITNTLQEDESVQANFKLPPGGPVCSIPGIGLITAVALLLCTNNFTAFDDSRKFASYCGVAPFEHSSGTSIRGRTKTSPLANKRVKALLSNGAATAIQFDEEMRNYYQRKVEEGKPKMVVINAVRAKLINRIFATINRGTEYVVLKQYNKAA